MLRPTDHLNDKLTDRPTYRPTNQTDRPTDRPGQYGSFTTTKKTTGCSFKILFFLQMLWFSERCCRNSDLPVIDLPRRGVHTTAEENAVYGLYIFWLARSINILQNPLKSTTIIEHPVVKKTWRCEILLKGVTVTCGGYKKYLYQSINQTNGQKCKDSQLSINFSQIKKSVFIQ